MSAINETIETLTFEVIKARVETEHWRRLLKLSVSRSCSHCTDCVYPGRIALEEISSYEELTTVELIKRLVNAAEELLKSLQFDDQGMMVGGQWRGGNGGLISGETIKTADALRRAIHAIRRTQ